METFHSYVLFIIVVLPLAGAGLLMAIPSHRRELIRLSAALVGLAVMLLTFYVFQQYDPNAGGFQFIRVWDWLELPDAGPLGELGIGLSLGVDGISAPMVLLTGVVMFTGVLISWRTSERSKDFFILYFLLLSGVFGVFVSLDLFFCSSSTSWPCFRCTC